jgi:hypothetical protein
MSECRTCGTNWVTGRDGTHSCTAKLVSDNDALTAKVADLEVKLIAAAELRASLRGTIKFCAIEMSNQDSKIEALEAKS